MNIVGQIDPSAFTSRPRMHHGDDEVALEFPSSAPSRRRNLLALRGMMWGAAKAPLPYDREVDWIGFTWGSITNASFIIVDIIPSLSDRIEVKWSDSTIPSHRSIFGTTRSGYWRRYALGCFADEFWIGQKSPSVTYGASGELVYDNKSVWIDGDLVASAPDATEEPTRGFLIGGMTSAQRGFVPEYGFSGKMHYFKFWHGGNLVLDYIPVVKDGVGYMFNRVDGTLRGNDGTNAFSFPS